MSKQRCAFTVFLLAAIAFLGVPQAATSACPHGGWNNVPPSGIASAIYYRTMNGPDRVLDVSDINMHCDQGVGGRQVVLDFPVISPYPSQGAAVVQVTEYASIGTWCGIQVGVYGFFSDITIWTLGGGCSAPEFVIAHEIFHVGGLDDNPSITACNWTIMRTGTKTGYPDPTECTKWDHAWYTPAEVLGYAPAP